jgi:hypothetical protein
MLVQVDERFDVKGLEGSVNLRFLDRFSEIVVQRGTAECRALEPTLLSRRDHSVATAPR